MMALRDLSKDGLTFRQNMGITSPQVITEPSSDFQQFDLLRTNLGIVTPVNQTITVQDIYPINFNAFKVRTNLQDGSGGAIADTKTILQSKCLVGWSGESKDSDIGTIRGLNVAGTVQSSVKKVGSNSLSYSGGGNSAIEFRLNETLKKAKAYSISCWARWNSFNYAGTWGMWAASVIGDVGITTSCSNTGNNPSGHNFFALANNQTVLVSAPIALGTLLINTWYHFIYEVNDTYLRIYLNGVLQATSPSFNNTIDFWTSAETFRLAGYASSAPSTQLNGYLDEFYVLSGALSQAEIDWLYNSGNGNTLL